MAREAAQTSGRRVRRLRDRRGRGLRGRLTPPELPVARTRAERFDDVVIEAVTHLEQRWADELATVEFAVEEVPPAEPEAGDPGVDPVPLAQLQAATGTGHATTPTRIVLYRRPLEARALDPDDLVDLVLDVLVHEVARLLGVDAGVVDPEGHPEEDEEDE